MERGDAMAGEELPSARAGHANHVLEIGRRRCRRADGGRVERPARQREQGEPRHAAPELEARRRNVVVRYHVADQVKQEAERDRGRSRPNSGPTGGAGRDMK